jgi:hypothetical protein
MQEADMGRADWRDQGLDAVDARFLMVTTITVAHYTTSH